MTCDLGFSSCYFLRWHAEHVLSIRGTCPLQILLFRLTLLQKHDEKFCTLLKPHDVVLECTVGSMQGLRSKSVDDSFKTLLVLPNNPLVQQCSCDGQCGLSPLDEHVHVHVHGSPWMRESNKNGSFLRVQSYRQVRPVKKVKTRRICKSIALRPFGAPKSVG